MLGSLWKTEDKVLLTEHPDPAVRGQQRNSQRNIQIYTPRSGQRVTTAEWQAEAETERTGASDLPGILHSLLPRHTLRINKTHKFTVAWSLPASGLIPHLQGRVPAPGKDFSHWPWLLSPASFCLRCLPLLKHPCLVFVLFPFLGWVVFC